MFMISQCILRYNLMLLHHYLIDVLIIGVSRQTMLYSVDVFLCFLPIFSHYQSAQVPSPIPTTVNLLFFVCDMVSFGTIFYSCKY